MRRDSPARVILAGIWLAFLLAAAGAGESRANGRAPAHVNVRFEPGATELMVVPATFGLLISRDAGQSFQWVCENAVGYGGMYDPDYAVDAAGNIYATTFDGLKISRDGGCTYELVAGLRDGSFANEVEIGPDGRVWAATSTGAGQNDVYVSEDGSTFASSNLFDKQAWWFSLRTTAADPMRIYVSGMLPAEGNSDAGTPAEALLRRSDDGGASWQELPVADIQLDQVPRLYLLGVSPMDPDLLFARSVEAAEPTGDILYRSEDGGMHWEAKLTFADLLNSFVIRADGMTVMAGTMTGCPEDEDPAAKGCVYISHDAGLTWALTREQPRLACLGERSDGTLFGCGYNWDPDNFALGRSQDGETWEKVYRFVETAGPLECAAGTNQHACASLLWPDLCEMFGICGGPDAGVAEEPGGGGCCKVDSGTDASWVPGVLVLLFLLVRRRRRPKAG